MSPDREPLTPVGSYDERMIQNVFDDWANRSKAWVVVGAPAWLERCGSPQVRRSYRTEICTSFNPDVLFELDRIAYVGELKWARSNKYNEMAIAEVLHHAWMFRKDTEAKKGLSGSIERVQPFIVVPYSAWTRATMTTLLEQGLREDALHYLEFVALERPGGGKRTLWFGDPITPIVEVPKPAWVPVELLEQFAFWYGGSGRRHVFGMKERFAGVSRVPFMRGSHVEVEEIPNTRSVIVARGDYSSERAWTYDVFDIPELRIPG